MLLYAIVLCGVHVKQPSQKHGFLSLLSLENAKHQANVIGAYGRCTSALEQMPESGNHYGLYMWSVCVVCICGLYMWLVYVVCICSLYMWSVFCFVCKAPSVNLAVFCVPRKDRME